MSDSFDELDAILDKADTDSEEVTSVDTASGFNDSELQDIMAEIESLEKDIEIKPQVDVLAEEMEMSGESVIEDAATPATKTKLQEEIENEIALSSEVSDEKKEELDAMALAESKILSFEKKFSLSSDPTFCALPERNPEVTLSANGQMKLNLGFKVGDDFARLAIDPYNGLTVTMNGIEVCINQENGCKITMENGAHFTIPLTSSDSANKKKSA